MGIKIRLVILSVAIISLFNGISMTEQQLPACNTFNSCVTCTLTNPNCGWCAATESCMEGDAFGPTNAKCLVTWEHGGCRFCDGLSTCRECLQYPADCFYCQNGNNGKGSCHHQGNPAPLDCHPTTTCQCAQYPTCGDCLSHGASICAWCPERGLCTPITQNSTGCYTDKCPCNKYHTCLTCESDANCDWCVDGGQARCVFNDNSTCLMRATSCEKFCEEAQDCSGCMSRSTSCGWCSSMQKCIDIDVVGCDAGVAHTCPTDPKLCNVRSSCEACTGIPGDPCAWCPHSQQCIDIDLQGDRCSADARIMETSKCGRPFSAGAFVGGMFLVIGVLVLAVVGYFVWIRVRGRRANYSVVNN